MKTLVVEAWGEKAGFQAECEKALETLAGCTLLSLLFSTCMQQDTGYVVRSLLIVYTPVP